MPATGIRSGMSGQWPMAPTTEVSGVPASAAGASGVSAPGGSGGLQPPAPGEEVVCVFPNHLEGREWCE